MSGRHEEARKAVSERAVLSAAVPFVDGIRLRAGERRILIGLAGPPAAGKSTLADALAVRMGAEAIVLPMDGYHLDNAILDERGLRARKGAPATFDVAGFASVVSRVRADRGEVIVPTFDRRLDLARAGARVIETRHRLVVVEGNYLLLDAAPWSAIAKLFDATIFLNVPEPVIEERILARWKRYGLDDRAARARALENDVPNASLVLRNSQGADLALDEQGWPLNAEGRRTV